MALFTPARPKRWGHRDDASVPLSTYRLQLSASFTFADAQAQLPYLAALGVSHLYLSPILEAAPGSEHFYDVVDHGRISSVLGGRAGLETLASAAREVGIGLIADIVPNHMAVPTPAFHNRALWSVLSEGKESPYAHWFDVDWQAGEPVLMAVLGDRIGTILARDELRLEYRIIDGFEDQGEVPVLVYWDHVFPVRPGTENLPIESLVEEQHYRLAYWRVGNEELNYRRFFDVRSLVGLRVEDPDVFTSTHKLIIDLVKDGTLTGLRVDHPDGLADPTEYVNRLAEATNGAWIVVEKILENDEPLPPGWHVAGATGYEAAWRIGGLLRDPAGAAALGAAMHRVTGDAIGSLPRLIEDAKLEIIRDSLTSEVERLASLAHTVCNADVRLRDHTWRSLHDCIKALLVAFDRYRTYIAPGMTPHPAVFEALDEAAARARVALDPERHETLDVVTDLLKGNEVGSAGRTEEATRRALMTRFQQVCGAVMAKGVEDTSYYRWTHLLPLCEVGSPAQRFAVSPAEFHAWAAERQSFAPHALTTLSTHDAKRSGDIRARLGVLSELSTEWDEWVTEIQAAAADLRPADLDGRTENTWWQTLVGSVESSGKPIEWERLEQFMIKAMRESKTHTSWTAVNETYESMVLWFCHATYADPQIQALVDRWTKVSARGVRAAILSQTLLQLTIPGIPDVYQGTELVRPLLVDPDNRRAADFATLASVLEEVKAGDRGRSLDVEKMIVTHRTLEVRRIYPDAFVGLSSGYAALPSSSDNAVVFARTTGDQATAVVVATRIGETLERLGGWRDSTVQLPAGNWRDAFTGATYAGGSAKLDNLLETLPVALLVREP